MGIPRQGLIHFGLVASLLLAAASFVQSEDTPSAETNATQTAQENPEFAKRFLKIKQTWLAARQTVITQAMKEQCYFLARNMLGYSKSVASDIGDAKSVQFCEKGMARLDELEGAPADEKKKKPAGSAKPGVNDPAKEKKIIDQIKKTEVKWLNDLEQLAAWSAKAVSPEKAREVYRMIVADDPNNKVARTGLGQVQSKSYGWVEKGDLEKIERGLVLVEDAWKSKDEIAQKRGGFRAWFNISTSQSSLEYLRYRYGYDSSFQDNGTHTYDIKSESFAVYVPKSYEVEKPSALFVYVDAGDNGSKKQWHKVFEKYKMLYVGANNSGNSKDVLKCRVPLAVDAVMNMKMRYNIDASKVFIGGFSGGGRVASGVALELPDLFAGGFYMCGCNRIGDGGWNKPADAKIMGLVQSRSRFVFLTGTKDFNRQDTQNVFDNYKANNVKNIHWLFGEGMNHAAPNAALFDKGLQYLLDLKD